MQKRKENYSNNIQLINSLLFTVTFILFTFSNKVLAQKQKPFMGMLEYKISARDTSMSNLIPDNRMTIYTNDTILRIENFTSQLGKQVVIRHIDLKKSYLLLDTEKGKFAIRTDESKSKKDTVKREFSFKSKCFKRKIVNRKANRVMVSHPEFKEPIEFWYFKQTSNKYSTFYPELSGLPVKFSIPTPDGVVDYELVRMSEYTPNHDLFGIPTDFKRITFDEFIEVMIGEKADIKAD